MGRPARDSKDFKRASRPLQANGLRRALVWLVGAPLAVQALASGRRAAASSGQLLRQAASDTLLASLQTNQQSNYYRYSSTCPLPPAADNLVLSTSEPAGGLSGPLAAGQRPELGRLLAGGAQSAQNNQSAHSQTDPTAGAHSSPSSASSPSSIATATAGQTSTSTATATTQSFTGWELWLIGLLISIILISIVGNCLVCVAIFTDRRLRKLGNAFIVSLAIADLFVSCLVMTFALCNDLMNYWMFGEWFCDIWISFDIMCCTASILNLCAISLDRFIHIKDCLLYNQLMTRRVAISAVIIIWIISALVSFVPINLGWHKPSHFKVPQQQSREHPDLNATRAEMAATGGGQTGRSLQLESGAMEDESHSSADYSNLATERNEAGAVAAAAAESLGKGGKVLVVAAFSGGQDKAANKLDNAGRRKRRSCSGCEDETSQPGSGGGQGRIKAREREDDKSLVMTSEIAPGTRGARTSLAGRKADEGAHANKRQATARVAIKEDAPTPQPKQPPTAATTTTATTTTSKLPAQTSFELRGNANKAKDSKASGASSVLKFPIGAKRDIANDSNRNDEIEVERSGAIYGLYKYAADGTAGGAADAAARRIEWPAASFNDSRRAGSGGVVRGRDIGSPSRSERARREEANGRHRVQVQTNQLKTSAAKARRRQIRSAPPPELGGNQLRRAQAAGQNGDRISAAALATAEVRVDGGSPEKFARSITAAAAAATAGANAGHLHAAAGGGSAPAELPQCMLTLTPTYAVISSTISFYIPCIIMLGLYTKLFACARRHVRNIKAISKAPPPIGVSAPPSACAGGLARQESACFGTLQKRELASSGVGSSSRSSSARHRQETNNENNSNCGAKNGARQKGFLLNHLTRRLAPAARCQPNVSEAGGKSRTWIKFGLRGGGGGGGGGGGARDARVSTSATALAKASTAGAVGGEAAAALVERPSSPDRDAFAKLGAPQSTNLAAIEERAGEPNSRDLAQKVNESCGQSPVSTKLISNLKQENAQTTKSSNGCDDENAPAGNQANDCDVGRERHYADDKIKLAPGNETEPFLAAETRDSSVGCVGEAGRDIINARGIEGAGTGSTSELDWRRQPGPLSFVSDGANSNACRPAQIIATTFTDIQAPLAPGSNVNNNNNSHVSNHYQFQQTTKQQTSQLATHKAAVTLGIIMGTFLFCWVPFFCLNIIKAFHGDSIPSSLFRAFTWLGYANSALNPIIYGIHNSEFRNAFNRIFFKHLTLKNGRQYLNRRFSYDLRPSNYNNIARNHHNNQQQNRGRLQQPQQTSPLTSFGRQLNQRQQPLSSNQTFSRFATTVNSTSSSRKDLSET